MFGDDGLISVAKNCPNLQELVLISGSQGLERFSLCGGGMMILGSGLLLFYCSCCCDDSLTHGFCYFWVGVRLDYGFFWVAMRLGMVFLVFFLLQKFDGEKKRRRYWCS